MMAEPTNSKVPRPSTLTVRLRGSLCNFEDLKRAKTPLWAEGCLSGMGATLTKEGATLA